MLDLRKNVRYPTHARAHISDVFETDALLKDLSITGCCIEYTAVVDIQPLTQYTITIIPEAAANIESFDIKAEARWVRPGEYSCDVGFMIIASPVGKQFQRYVDYLSWRSQPE